MERTRFKKYSTGAQVFGWFLLLSIMFVDSLNGDTFENAALYAINFVGFQVLLVYGHYRFFLPIFNKGHKVTYVILTLGLIFLFTNLIIVVDSLLPYHYLDTVEKEGYWDVFSYTLPLAILLVAASSAYYFVEAWYLNLKRETALKSEKLQAELNFLRSQINPHFLFNTLNNIYSYVQTGNEKSAPMLERLSSVLRYMVYECTEDKVMLQKEAQAIDDLLEIYRMKNFDQNNIELRVEGVKAYQLVAPLILVNLVENACKHSDAVTNPKGHILVEVNVTDANTCEFRVSNSVKIKTELESKFGGVGSDNIMQRLNLQYADRYEYEAMEEDRNYYISLKLPLERK